MVTFIDNHDRNRFLTEAGGNVAKMQNALTFIHTCRGIPVVFRERAESGNANGQAISGIADTYNRWCMQTKDANGNVTADYFNTNTDTYQLIASLNELRQEYRHFGKEPSAGCGRHLISMRSPEEWMPAKKVGEEVICAFNNSSD